MTQSMYQSDKMEMKKVIAFFWGDRVANSIPLTERTATFLAQILEESGACSETMDLVPRPSGSLVRPGISYAIKQIKRVASELVKGNQSQYISCKNIVALKYRTAVAEMVNGI